MTQYETFTTVIDRDGVMTVTFDAPSKSVNTLSTRLLEELDDLIAALERDERVTGVIYSSAKDVFLTGADLIEMQALDDVGQRRFIERGQEVITRLARLEKRKVAAIGGHCLGGGLELALACDWRVAVDEGSIHIGLPEVKLGILPAWGGTTRLVRLVGMTKALPLLLAGKVMPPRKAQRAGVIDEVVRREAMPAAARRLVGSTPPKRGPGMFDRLVAGVGPLRAMVRRSARRRTLAETHGNYPAPEALIDVASTAASGRDEAAGLEAEREAVERLRHTPACANLMRLFALKQEAKRSLRAAVGVEVEPIERAAVVGGGTMGAGIVHALAKAGIDVRLIEVSAEAMSAALRRVRAGLDGDVKAKRLSPLEAEAAMRRVSPSVGYAGLSQVQLVIEAVAERMDVKREVFAKLDALAPERAVLATNTSSLSVAEMASATARPERVIGLHFFNPVSKMPLVEVVGTVRSDARALAIGASTAQRLGKVAVLVGDAPGFVVNRVLIPYLAEAMTMASEGRDIEAIDGAMVRFGMPMGPFALLDQIGLDVGLSVLASVGSQLHAHLQPPDEAQVILDEGWLGRKAGRGFYVYSHKRRKPRVHEALRLQLSRGRDAAPLEDEAVVRRLVLPMVNEASRLLDEGVIESEAVLDLATVLGIGFAPHRGGLMRYAKTYGLGQAVRDLSGLARLHGARFEPDDALRRYAEGGALTPAALDEGPVEAEKPRGRRGEPWPAPRGTTTA